MRDKRGVTTLEVLFWAIGSVAAAIAYAHATFATYREIEPRVDRMEAEARERMNRMELKIDAILEKI